MEGLLTMEDDVLWAGIREGDREQFLALYRKYYHSLLFIGLKEIKDACLVKDAIQQQFLYLWEKRETVQPAQNVRAYLITSFLRRLNADWKSSRKAGNLQVAWSLHIKEHEPTPEEKLVNKDENTHLSRRLLHYINTLPSRQKELILLRFYEGLSYDEIAGRTGLAHRTVYNKVHEALKTLRQHLEKEEGGYSYGSALSILLITLFAAGHLPDLAHIPS